jgi:hypothetical protein
VVVVAAVFAVVAGVSSVALAGGSLVDGRGDGPGLRAAPPTATKAAPASSGQRANAANVPSSRPIIAARAAGPTKLASKLLRASA